MAVDDLLGGDIQFRLGIDDKMSGGIRQADTAMLAFSGNVDRALSSIRRLAPAAAEITSIGLLAKNSVDAFAEWQEQLTSLNAVLGVSSDQIKKVGQAELDLGTKTIFTAKQINDATTTIAKAGNDAATSLKILPDALDLAAASLTTTKDAAIGLVTAQKAFNISNNDSADTANILSKAVNSSVGSFQTMTSELKAAGPIATVAGQSLKETANALASLENAGLEGAAGMAYKVFLEHVLNESPAAKKIVDELGISFFDQAGKMKSVADIADQLYLKMGNLSDQQKGQDLNTIFGNYGGRVADIFANVGSSGLQDVEKNQLDMADASDIAKERADSLSGALSRLRGAGDVVRIQIGEGLAPAVSTLAGTMQKASEATGHIIEATGPLTQMAVGLALVTAAYKGMNLVMDSATVKFGTMNQALEASIRPIDERAAALEHFNAIAPQKAGVDALVNQINAQNDAIARAGGTVTPPSQSLLDKQKLLKDQEDLLRKGATVSETEAYATRLEAYQESLARRKALLEEQDAWEEAERKRSTAALAEIDAKYVSKGKAVPQKIADAAAEQPFGKVIPITPVEPTFDEVNIAPAEAATLKSKIGGALSKAGLGFGKLLIPVTVGVMVEQLILEPVANSLASSVANSRTKDIANATAIAAVTSALPDKQALDQQINDAQKVIDDATKKRDAILNDKNYQVNRKVGDIPIVGSLSNAADSQLHQVQDYNDAIQKNQELLKKAQDTEKNLPAQVNSEEAQRIQDLADKIRSGTITAKEAQDQFSETTVAVDQYSSVIEDTSKYVKDMGGTQQQADSLIKEGSDTFIQASKDRQQQLADEDQALADHMAALEEYRNDLELGVDPNAASLATLGTTMTGAAGSKEDIRVAKEQITDLTKAWTDAQSAFSSLNITSLQSFADSAPKLEKAQEELQKVGQDSQAVDTLADIAGQFKAITDQEKEAESAFNAIMLLYNQSGTSITFLDNFQKQVDAANAYAQKRINLGIGTSADYQEVANYKNVKDNLTDMSGQLQERQVSDVLGLSKVIPDLIEIDTKFRDTASKIDLQKLIMTVDVDVSKAQSDLNDFIKNNRNMTMEVTLSTVQDNINNPLIGSGTVPPNGGSVPPAGGGGSTGYAGAAPPFPGPGQAGQYLFGPNNPGGTNPYAAGTNTPRGNASALLPYADLIKQASQVYGVPEWLIGAVIMHESGGVPGAIQPNGLGRGLMQVDIGQNPQYADADLTGTSRDSIATQIKDGTIILRDMLKSRGPVEGVQGYAGPDYKSVEGGGVPGGLDLPTELSDYYKPAVTNVLEPPSASGSGFGKGGGSVDGAANTVGQEIVRKAMQSLNTDTLAGYCEQFVEETVQSITGQRGATGRREPTAKQAFYDAQSQGLEVTQEQAQPGDLVYYPDAANSGGAGHVAIYMGGGKQVSTEDVGGSLVHTEGVLPNARYVSVGGSPYQTEHQQSGQAYSNIGPSSYGAGGDTGSGTPGTINGQNPNPEGALLNDPYGQQRKAFEDYGSGSAQQMIELLNSAEHGLDSTGAAAVNRYQNQFESYATTVAKDASQTPNNKLYGQTPEYLQGVVDVQTLNATTAYAKLVNDIEHNTGNIAADEKEVRATSGPIADDAIREAEAVGKSASALRDKLSLQQANLNLDAQAKQNTIDRAAADEKIADNLRTQQRAWQDYDLTLAASQLKSSRAEEDLKVKWQDQFDAWTRANQMATDTENIRWTTVSRQEQDQQRALQFQQQVQATDLQNKLADTQKAQQQQIWQRTSAEQVFAAQVKAAPTNQAAATAAAQLSMMHDQDLAQKDLNTQAIESIQLQIREQAKAANLASYNLQTAQIAEQRAHEDVMTRISQSSQAISFAQQDLQKRQAALDLAQTRYYEDAAVNLAAYRLKVTRGQEDDATNLAKARKTQDDQNAKDKQANNDRITQDDQIIADSGTITTDIENTFTQIDNWIVKIGADAAGAFGKFTPAPNQATPTVATLPGHAGGGTITEPLTVVGEEGPELLAGAQGMAVYNAAQTQAYLSSQGNGNTLVVQMPITVNAAGQVDEEAIIAAVMPKVENKIRSVLRSSNNQKKAVGR